MASDITLSSAVRNNLLSLQKTATLLSKTQERLATGLKVNSALDDPTAFFTSLSLSDRASDLNRLQDFVGNAVQTLRAADEGISGITNLLETAEATARQALESASSISTFLGNNTTALASTTDLSTLNAEFSGSQTIAITTGTNETTTLTLDANSTVADIVTAINDNTLVTAGNQVDNVNGTVSVGTAGGAEVRATLTADGKIKLEGADSAATIQIAITNNDDNATAGAFRTAVAALGFDDTTGTYVEGVAATSTASFTTTIVAAGTENTDRTSLASQFDELRTQIDQLALDSGFNGVNLLDGDALTVIFNEQGTSSISLSGVTFSSSGLGLTTTDNTFQTDFDIRFSIEEIETAINSLRSQASKFGSNLSVVEARQDFTKELINVLETGAANLTLADTNEEGANLLALQTRQQLSSTALSLASQADQNVLRLFG
ncbi:MAG: flagellin [Methyloligellaceae bacterium]